jgi:hypothetical protein
MYQLSREKEAALNQKIYKVLNFLLLFFYVCLVFLWFKNNIHPLKKIGVSYLLPFILIIGILLIQFFLRIKYKRIGIGFRLNKVFWAVLILILLALAFRLPSLVHSFGLMTSDDAIPALMAKHISEGKLPPVYYYGQLYMGSFSQHIFAFMFVIFGYSIFLLKFTTLLFFLAFIAIQFIFMKEIFSFRLSFIISLFYCLPIGHLIPVTFDNTGAFSLVLFLGSSILYISYLIYWKNNENLIPLLGFLMGISFWTHQITVCFISTSFVILLFKFKLRLKKYFSLFFFFLIGCLPLLMVEIYENFLLLKFLAPGKIELAIWEKLKTTVRLTLSLVSLETHPSSIFFLVFILLGCLTLLYFSIRKRELLPQSMYSIFFIIFFMMYLFSGFSNIPVNRYLYPLYFCLPVLLVSPFLFVKSRKEYLLSLVLILLLLFPYNLKQNCRGYVKNRDTHLFLNRVVASMKETGKQYWRGDYWTAYLITALSKENIIVDSYTVNRYYPYTLLYYNENQSENYIFLRGPGHVERDRAKRLIDLFDTLNIDFKEKKVGDTWLIYDVKYPVSRRIFSAPIPSKIPNLVLSQVSSSRGYLNLAFENKETGEGLEYRIAVDIPGYSSVSRRFMLDDKKIPVRIPFPRKKSFKIRYYLEYERLKINSTVRELSYSLSDDKLEGRRANIVYLSGVRPAVDMQGTRMRICEKVTKIEVNNIFKGKAHKIQLYLYSPFEFFHPYWYGDNYQTVRIEINGFHLTDKILKDGYNVIEIDGNSKTWLPENGTIIITLRFKYQLLFNFAPFWRTSALLEKVEIK